MVHTKRYVSRATFWFVDTHIETDPQTDRRVENNSSFRYRGLVITATLAHAAQPRKQVALLSQRGRAMLRVIEYYILLSHLRSLKVIRNDTFE